jgi:hypothetical protein
MSLWDLFNSAEKRNASRRISDHFVSVVLSMVCLFLTGGFAELLFWAARKLGFGFSPELIWLVKTVDEYGFVALLLVLLWNLLRGMFDRGGTRLLYMAS